MTDADSKKKPAKKKKADPEVKGLKKRVALADARKAELEVHRAELAWELDQMRAEEARHLYRLKANADTAHGHFSLEKSVGRSAVELAAEIRQYARTYPGKPVTLNIFSPGGSVFDGLVLYDTLRTIADQGHPVTTVARGMAASMGSILFLAGDNRLIGPEAMVMFHCISSVTFGSLHEMEEDIEFSRRLNKRLYTIVASRSKITAKDLAEKTKKKDWWIDVDQALKLKVATARA